jgi:hypothetical protein
MQRDVARAKQRETKQRAGFDYVLPMGKSGAKRKAYWENRVSPQKQCIPNESSLVAPFFQERRVLPITT